MTDEAVVSDVGIEADDLVNEAANANVANRANEASFADEADDAVESDAANEADSADKAADAAETRPRRLMWPTMPLLLTMSMVLLSFTPSRNILQS